MYEKCSKSNKKCYKRNRKCSRKKTDPCMSLYNLNDCNTLAWHTRAKTIRLVLKLLRFWPQVTKWRGLKNDFAVVVILGLVLCRHFLRFDVFWQDFSMMKFYMFWHCFSIMKFDVFWQDFIMVKFDMIWRDFILVKFDVFWKDFIMVIFDMFWWDFKNGEILRVLVWFQHGEIWRVFDREHLCVRSLN